MSLRDSSCCNPLPLERDLSGKEVNQGLFLYALFLASCLFFMRSLVQRIMSACLS